MDIGLSILLVGCILAFIYLYSITRDRWNWSRMFRWLLILINLVISSLIYLGIVLLIDNQDRFFRYLVVPISCYVLLLQFRNLIGENWDWKKIQKKVGIGFLACGLLLSMYLGFVTIRTWNEERKAQIAEQRESNARTCNAAEIQRIEPEIKKISSEFTSEDSLPTILEKMKIFSVEGSLGVAEENIKYQVASFLVKPKCDTTFEFLIEIFFDENKKVKEFKTWAINPPLGYIARKSNQSSEKVEWERILVEELSAEYDRFGGRIVRGRNLLDPENKGNEYEDLIPKKNVRLDPCAPGISSKERLKRLSKFGEVRQVGPGDYEAGGRRVSIFEYDNSLIYCR